MARNVNNKEAILDAAEAVVMEMGAAHLSLDVVARKAKVSKGGLMYHFHTKNALLKAMLERLIEKYYADRQQCESSMPESPSRQLKAGVMTTLTSNEERDRMGLSILAVAAANPEMLEPIRKAHKEHLQWLLSSGMPFEKTAIISLASDGLMLLRLLKLSPYSDQQLKRIKDAMLEQLDKLGQES